MKTRHAQRTGIAYLGAVLIVFGLVTSGGLIATSFVGATPMLGTATPSAYIPIALKNYPPLPAVLFGRILALDGVDDYANTPDNPTLDLGVESGADFTIETFLYVPNLDNATTDTLIWKQGAYGVYILFKTSAPDRFIYRIWTSPTTYFFLYADVDLAVGWHHIAAVFDNEYTTNSDLMALYVDGSLAASSTAAEWTPGILNTSSPVNIGAYVGVNPQVGWLEEIRLSDSVRYSGTSFTVPAAVFANDAHTRALWHFNETVGSTTFSDSSGHGNTLAGLNGAQVNTP